jgi:hypothetical protein
MRRSTKRKIDRRRKTKRATKRDIRRLRGGGIVKEQLWGTAQAPHASKWPVYKMYSTVTGKYGDILNQTLGRSIHEIEYALNNIMYYEMPSVNRGYFKDLVWLGQEFPVKLNPKGVKKGDERMAEEKALLEKIHGDKEAYTKELEDWIQFYNAYIRSPLKKDGTVITDAKELLTELNQAIADTKTMNENFKAMNEIALEVAKMARITWMKNQKLNHSIGKIGQPIEVNPIPDAEP